MCIVIAGATGFIGRALSAALCGDYEVIALSRDARRARQVLPAAVRPVQWDARTKPEVVILGSAVGYYGPGGGALQKMALPFRFHVGGRIGSGRQWMSWVSLRDEVATIKAQHTSTRTRTEAPRHLVLFNVVETRPLIGDSPA